MLNLYPYKSKILHELKDKDFAKRVNFAKWFLSKDLIADYCAKYPNVFTVAFSLVDPKQNLIEVAKRKLVEKGVSLIVGNNTETLGSADISAWIVDSQGSTRLEGSKKAVAGQIVQRISDHLNG